MDHLPELSFVTTVSVPSPFLISIWRMSASVSARTLGGASLVSLAGFFALASSLLLDHHRAPASPARTTAAIRSRDIFTLLSPAPPDTDAQNHHQQRQRHDAFVEHQTHLPRTHLQAAIFRLFGANGDEILVRAQPRHHVQEQVPIPAQRDGSVGGPRGASRHHETPASVLAARVVSARGPQDQR